MTAHLIAGAWGNFLQVLKYPATPKERIFVPYLATSLLLAVAAFAVRSRRGASLREFLFPVAVWRNPSAWLDVRYFFFHQILRVFLYGGFAAAVTDASFRFFAGILGAAPAPAGAGGWAVTAVFVLFSTLLLDFAAWAIHYAQHRVPLLWEFHKVHHSAPVMHPLTNYREHPVDNVAYALGTGAVTGASAAAGAAVFGYVPAEPKVLGVGVCLFLFNALGYNLRHSHVWIRWPGPLAYAFGCPAHHQVHHSRHPAHVDKNFAFMFPVWDLAFGTFVLPETNRDVAFGVEDGTAYASVLEVYGAPFRGAWRRLTGSKA